MGKQRCGWCLGDDLYKAYHDNEWGVPVKDDDTLFEFLILETFQAGLSWITILRKRENFRKAFDNFEYLKISKYKDTKIQELLQNEGIIRNKLKVRAT
ncbi:MAG: DNA-3-methyladenine glycosylase I, partial [Maribacter sp.]|nr:DNA-3-methyladenine glycosylase I [Maribacter sp.]